MVLLEVWGRELDEVLEFRIEKCHGLHILMELVGEPICTFERVAVNIIVELLRLS